MAEVKKTEVKPLYRNTAVCQNCTAEFKNCRWMRGYYIMDGTSLPQFVPTGEVQEGYCPFCLTKLEIK